ncbi:MAG: peptidylprolyl isomerase [Planctomycetota bacterium]
MNPALLDPIHADNLRNAPATFRVRFETSCGDITVQVNRSWSPLGADRFYALVTSGYFDGCAFFRVVPGFVVQFGLNGDPKITAAWRAANIHDDPVTQTNNRGRLTFATAGPNTRTTQLFINLANNPRLDSMGFSPFGEVVEGMDVVDKINKEYGERPNQALIQTQGEAYLSKSFPKLDIIQSAKILP